MWQVLAQNFAAGTTSTAGFLVSFYHKTGGDASGLQEPGACSIIEMTWMCSVGWRSAAPTDKASPKEQLMPVVVLLIAYLLGSIPFSLVVAYLWAGIDLRRTGSGNPGGMNTLRETGWPAGLLAIVLDLAKGTLAVLLGKALLPGDWGGAAAGVLAVTGHCYSIFLMVSYIRETTSRREDWLPWWKMQPRLGGKGLASALGVLLALSWPTLLGALMLFALIALVLIGRGLRGSPVVAQATSIVILVSPAMLWFWHRSWPILIGGIVMAMVTTIKHVPYLELTPTWPRAHPYAVNAAPAGAAPETASWIERGP